MDDNFSVRLRQVMEEHHCFIDGMVNLSISKPQRFRNVRTPHKRAKDLFVIVHNDGEGATFGDWHYPEEWRTWWCRDFKELTLYQRAERQKTIDLQKKQQEAVRQDAIYRAKLLFNHMFCKENTWKHPFDIFSHPYIVNKRIKPLYAKQLRSYLIIPIHDIDRNLISLQYIKKNGFKQFKKTASPKGGMIWLSEPLPDDYNGVIRVCEGWATGCTIYEAIGAPVVCGLNTGNMSLVIALLKKKYPHSILKICADNDQWSETNYGINVASLASKLTGASVCWPEFNGLDVSNKPTDFNDLLCLSGIEEVEKQLIHIKKL